jgi:hypothetical protein
LWVGVIDADALVTVGDADSVFDGDAVTVTDTEADSDADSEADSDADSLADSDADSEAEAEADSEADALTVTLMLWLAVSDGVMVLVVDAPISRWQMHDRRAVHSSEDATSSLKYRYWSKYM